LEEIPKFDALLYKTNVVQLASDPIATGTLLARKSFPKMYEDVTMRYSSVTLTWMVDVTVVGTGNGFTFAIYNNTIGDFTKIELPAYSTLRITKIK
jgi:hypothetical protein